MWGGEPEEKIQIHHLIIKYNLYKLNYEKNKINN